MKKFLSLVLALALCLSLVACGSSDSNDTADTAETPDSSAEGATETSVTLPKNIEVQVPASAGGGTDVVARALTTYISSNSDSNMTVMNNTDGSGVVAFETVRTGATDGSDLLFFHTTMCIKTASGMYDYSAAEDFKVVGAALPTNPGGYVLVVPGDSGIEDLDAFIEAAKAGGMNIGVETNGSSHIMAGILAGALGVELEYVEAGSDTDKLTNLVGGSIDCALVNANQAKQYVEAGKVNALGCFSATDEGGRNTILPDVPSLPELGYTDCVFGTYMFVLANKDMDDATAQAINDLFTAAALDPDTAEILEGSGMGMEFVPYEEAQAVVADQQETLTAVCAELGISVG